MALREKVERAGDLLLQVHLTSRKLASVLLHLATKHLSKLDFSS